MARPRKPTALLELSGAFDHDPQRRRPNEPQDERPLGDPPTKLTKAQRDCWDELIATACPGVLTHSDRWAVEIASRLMWKVRRGKNTVAELNILVRVLNSMGMDPSGKAKLNVPTEKPRNEYASLAQEAAALNIRPN